MTLLVVLEEFFSNNKWNYEIKKEKNPEKTAKTYI